MSLKENEVERISDRDQVLEEKNKLAEACASLSKELGSNYETVPMYSSSENSLNWQLIDSLMIEISHRLSNIAGFCDRRSRERVHEMKALLTRATAVRAMLMHVKALLPMVAGVEVNFTKRPFKLLKFNIKDFSFEAQK